MVHDYLHFMLADILDKNGEIYLTEDTLRLEQSILGLLGGMTPDFVIRRGGGGPKH